MTILDEAAAATSSDRPSIYGHPSLHFACTAQMVTAYLRRRGLLKDGAELRAEDWSQLMLLDKVARQAGALTGMGQIHRDTAVDQAGYARTSEMLAEETHLVPIRIHTRLSNTSSFRVVVGAE